MTTRAAILLASALACSSAMAADAPTSLEARGVVATDSVNLPSCDNPGVFRRIASAFHDKERTYWQSDLRLTAFSQPVEIAYRPWGQEFIARRFCKSRAEVSDGVVRDVYYAIGHDTGTLGVVNGVDFCVTGLDRNLAYAPNCKMAGP